MMKNGNEKKGLFAKLLQPKKVKKSSGCCAFEIEEIEEINDEKKDIATEKSTKPNDKDSCCKR